jgi:hypothetical protein
LIDLDSKNIIFLIILFSGNKPKGMVDYERKIIKTGSENWMNAIAA